MRPEAPRLPSLQGLLYTSLWGEAGADDADATATALRYLVPCLPADFWTHQAMDPPSVAIFPVFVEC